MEKGPLRKDLFAVGSKWGNREGWPLDLRFTFYVLIKLNVLLCDLFPIEIWF